MLNHPNVWHRRQAQRLLIERTGRRDIALPDLAWTLEGRRQYAWTSLASRRSAVKSLAQDADPAIRAWAARSFGDRRGVEAEDLERLKAWSTDADVTVRAAAAIALQQLNSGSLTVSTAPLVQPPAMALLPHFSELFPRPSVAGDFYYPHIVWMAMEPRVAEDPTPFFPLFPEHETPVSAYCTQRAMRRVCDLTEPAQRLRGLDAALTWLGTIGSNIPVAGAALDGLIEAFQAKGTPPSIPLDPILSKLMEHPQVPQRRRRGGSGPDRCGTQLARCVAPECD